MAIDELYWWSIQHNIKRDKFIDIYFIYV